MKPEDLKLGRQLNGTFSYISQDIVEKDKGKMVSLSIEENNAEILLSLADGRSLLIIAVNRDARRLIEEAQSNIKTSLCWIVSVQQSVLILQLHIFPNQLTFSPDNPLNIAVTDAIISQIPEEAKQFPSFEFLKNEFFLENITFAAHYTPDSKADFVLIGKRWACDIEFDLYGVPKCRNLRRKPRNLHSPISLLKGTIEFVDNTLAKSANVILNQLKDAIYGSESYLNTWEVYNDLEEQLRKNEAIELGKLWYKQYERSQVDDGVMYTFYLAQPAPSSFRPKSFDLDAFSSEPFIEIDGSVEFDDQEKPVYVGEILVVNRNMLSTKIDAESWREFPSEQGYLIRSIRGDEIRLKRRRDALNRVREISNPLLTLGLLLEKGNAPVAERHHHKALSDRVRKALGYKPTPSQEEALDIALNTPDIAVIQGPPGTGKTTVIRALRVRLSELSEKRGDKASILITSYQHDAVDNALKGMGALDLPPNRIGGKRGESYEIRAGKIWNWIDEQKQFYTQVLQEHYSSPVKKAARDIDRLIFQWRTVRGSKEAVSNLVKDILDIAGKYLSSGLLEELRQVSLNPLEHREIVELPKLEQHSEQIDQARGLLHSQRTELISFVDDGPFQAKRLLKFFERSGSSFAFSIPEALSIAAEWDIEHYDAEKLALFLKHFARSLVDLEAKIGGSQNSQQKKPLKIGNLDQILLKISEAMHEQSQKGTDGIAEAIQAFIEELEDEEAIQRVINKYSDVVAATCQQTVSRRYGMENQEYDVVIIDEAARANPLDLLIPMSLGKRIVLVGDHEQLPHVLEEEIVENFKQNKEKHIVEFLQKSLFQRFFEQFEKEKQQGRAKRTVTLLDDFRMHPTISKFISTTFYPDKDITPFWSADARSHNLNIYGNKSICWIDVPKSRGQETKEMSKTRPIEVEVIAAEVEKVLQKSQEFSIGIITFYSKQANLIQAEIEKQIPVSQRERDRILVGTVDAFQGREFDLVFLSVVRCNDYPLPSDKNYQADLRKRVGFLASKNRLCVALSRAKCLLVVVGDAETVVGTPDAHVVKQLYDFYQLCRSEEGWYESRK